MKKRTAHKAKSEKIKKERGFSPEDVISGEFLGYRVNSKYPTQRIEHYFFDGYVWEVPVDIETERLITAYKSRKYKKEYGK